jgi:two-component system NtrC family sensor kinase
VKLAFKFMAAVMLVMAVLLIVHAYFVVQRELNLFQEDMRTHADLLGSVLASSIADMWRINGPERVQEIIDDANRSQKLMHIRWVWLDVPPNDPYAPHTKIDDLSDLKEGHEVIIPRQRYGDADYFHAYFPVQVDPARLSALELSQPLAPMYSYLRATVLNKVILYVAFVLVGSIMVWWLGVQMVGQPVRSMADLARRVGEGDLTARSDPGDHKDELAQLARGLNQMVEDLEHSRDRLEEETTRRIETMEQLHHAERLATVGKLASGLAHELGTPLNVVSGRAQMIATEDMSDDEIVDSATVIKDQSERMTRIIRQLLDFARSRRPEKQKSDPAEIVKNVVAVLGPVAAQRNVTLKPKAHAGEIAVEVDRGQMQQVLSNLIMNAIHAMPDGGEIELEVSRERVRPPADRGLPEGEYAVLKVIDHGVGISPEDLPRVFTPFFSTKGVGEGTGLGLSIAHGIVREHGGWLTAESQVGKGSCFSIYLRMDEES